jgi:hypothetical protein
LGFSQEITRGSSRNIEKPRERGSNACFGLSATRRQRRA